METEIRRAGRDGTRYRGEVRGRGFRRRHPDDAGVTGELKWKSLEALLQGMGLMHLAQASHHAAGEPVAAVAGDCEVRAVTAAATLASAWAVQHGKWAWR